MKATITYVGGPGDGNTAMTSWRDPLHNLSFDFPLNRPVTLDSDAEPNIQRRTLIEHIIRKAPTNRFFSVVTDDQVAEEEGEEERAVLMAEAESLGVDVDRRWSDKTLRMKVAAARKAD